MPLTNNELYDIWSRVQVMQMALNQLDVNSQGPSIIKKRHAIKKQLERSMDTINGIMTRELNLLENSNFKPGPLSFTVECIEAHHDDCAICACHCHYRKK